MKKFYLFFGLALCMLTVGCSKDDPKTEPDEPTTKEAVNIIANAVDELGLWQEGAKIAVNGVESKEVAIDAENPAKGVFAVEKATAPFVVIAPFSAYEAGDIVKVPDTQNYVAGGYDHDAYIMYGYAEKFDEAESEQPTIESRAVEIVKVKTATVDMQSFCGIIALPLTVADGAVASIKSIDMTGNDAEMIAGSWKFNVKEGTVTVEKPYDTIVLDCGEGVALGAEPTVFRFVVPAGKYTQGVEFTIEDAEGHKDVCEFKDEINVVAGEEYSVAATEFHIIEKAAATLNITINEAGIKWAAGDKVVINGQLSSEIAAEEAGTSTGTFNVENVARPYKVLYPQDLYTTSGRLRLYNEQRLIANDCDREALAMVGYSTTTDVTMHNVCGLIKIPVTNGFDGENMTINRIRIKSNDGSALCGKFNINYRNATLSAISVVDSLAIVPAEGTDGVVVPAGETVNIYAVVPAGKFPKGITLDVYTNVANRLDINCVPAEGLTVTRGENTDLETLVFEDVKIEKITTAEELREFADCVNFGRYKKFLNADGEVTIGADFDLAEIDLPLMTGPKNEETGEYAGFSGIINGGGFTLSNIHSGLFGKLASGAVIKDLKFTGFNSTSAAVIDNIETGATLENIEIAGATSFINKCAGTVKQLTVSGNIDAPVINAVEEGGNVETMNISNLAINSAVINSCAGTVSAVTVSGNTMSAPVFGTVSGTGRIDGVTVDANCKFEVTDVPQPKAGDLPVGVVANNVAGYIGNVTSAATVVIGDSATKANFDTTTRYIFGGVVGLLSGTIENCTTAGGSISVTGKDVNKLYVGGIIGWANDKATLKVPLINASPVTVDMESCKNPVIGGVGAYISCDAVATETERFLNKETGKISLKITRTDVDVSANEGGVFGHTAKAFKFAENKADIYCYNAQETKNNCYVGGVLGIGDGEVAYCNNYGTIDAYCAFTSVFGGVASSITAGPMHDCVNNGTVKAKAGALKSTNVGGIVGYMNNTSKTDIIVKNCTNNGIVDVDGTDGFQMYVTGIVGYYNGGKNQTRKTWNIDGCVNNGDVTLKTNQKGRFNYVGGILSNYKNGLCMKDCVNTAEIYGYGGGRFRIGGIGGAINYAANGCVHSGVAKLGPDCDVATSGSESQVGGIAGYYNCYFADCETSGKVICETVGGFAGGIAGWVSTCKLEYTNCKMSGSVETVEGGYAGIILGGQNKAAGALAEHKLGTDAAPLIVTSTAKLNGVAITSADVADKTKICGRLEDEAKLVTNVIFEE